MADMISRTAAVRIIADMHGLCRDDVLRESIQAIKELPAVDAVPVIRCASCKWWNGSALGVAHRCAALHIATTGEFYCAAAERKTNAFADQSGAEYADNPTV